MAASAGKIKAGQAYVEITADNSKLMRGLQNAQNALKAFGQSLKGVGADMMQLGGIMALPFISAVRSFSSFDDNMQSLRAISGASYSEIASLRKMIRNLGATTAFTAQQVAQGTVELARMGFSSFELQNAIKPVMDLVRATGTETFRLGEVSEYAASSLRQFGLDSSKFNDVCDVMAYASNRSAMNIGDLGEAMKIAGPSAKSVNENIRDTASALMLMANAGIKGSLAGTSLRKVYQSLAAQSGNVAGMDEEQQKTAKKGRTQLIEMGIELVDPKTGNLRKASDIMFDLAKKVRQMKSGERINFATDVFDLRGSLGALSMLNNSFDLKDFRNQLNNVSGYAAKTASEMEKSIGGMIRLIISQVQEMQIAVGEAFWDTFKDWISKIPQVTKSIISFINANKKLVGQIAIVVGSTFVFGAALFGLGAAIKIVSFGLGGLIVAMKTITSTILLPVNALILLKNTFLSFSNILSIISVSLTTFLTICKSAVILTSAFIGLVSIHKSLRLIGGSAKFAGSMMNIFSYVVRAGAGLWRAAFIGLSLAVRGMIGILYAAIGAVRLFQGVMIGLRVAVIGISKSFVLLKTALSVFNAFIQSLSIIQVSFASLGSVISTSVAAIFVLSSGLGGLASVIITISSGFIAFGVNLFAISKTSTIISVVTKSFSILKSVIASVMIPIIAVKNVLLAFGNTFNIFMSAKSSVLALASALKVLLLSAGALSAVFSSLLFGIGSLIHPIGMLMTTCAVLTSVISGMAFSILSAGVSMIGTGNITKLLNAVFIGLKSTVLSLGSVFTALKIIFKSTMIAFQMFIPIMRAFISAGLSGALVMKQFTFICNVSRGSWLAVRVAINGVKVSMGALTSSMIVSKTASVILIGLLRTFVVIYNSVRTAVLSVKNAYTISKVALQSLLTAQKAYNGIMLTSRGIINGFYAAIKLLRAGLVALRTAIVGIKLSALAGSFLYVTAAVVAGIVVWKTLVAVFKSLSGAFSSLMSSLSSIGSSIKTVFSNIWNVGKEAFGIIKDSMMAGDTAGAAKVALAALYLVWVEGTTPIYNLWLKLKKNLIDIWIGFKANVVLITNDIWFSILEGLQNAGILDTLDVICVGIVNSFERALLAIQKAWRTLRGKMAGKSDAEIKVVTDAYDRYYNASVKDRERRLQARIAGRKNGGLAKQRAASEKKINDDAKKASEENVKNYTDAKKKSDFRMWDAKNNYSNAKKFAAQWNTMNAAVKALQKNFDNAQEDYRLNTAPNDVSAKRQEEQFRQLQKTDPDRADQLIRQAVLTERKKAEAAKDEFEKQLEAAKADRVIDNTEKTKLESLAAAYGRAQELYQKYNSMLGNAAEGTAGAIATTNSNSNGTFSAFQAYFGLMGNLVKNISDNTTSMNSFTKKQYNYMLTRKGLKFG